MLAEIGQAAQFEGFFTASKVGKTGLTVTVDVRNHAGTLVVTDGSATEVGGGFYTYTLANGSVTAAGNYRATFKTSDATVDQQHVPALWVVGKPWVEKNNTSLPNVAPGANGGLPTVDASNRVTALLSVGTGAGQVNASGGKVPATLATGDVTGNLPAQTKGMDNNVITAASIAADAITAAKIAADAVTKVQAGLSTLTEAQANAQADAALADAGVTLVRMGYLDNANVGGLLASAASIQAITQAQRVRVLPPAVMERPDSGSTTYRVWIYAYDEGHKAEDLDANPTITAEDGQGNSLDANLGAVQKPGGTTGQYYVDYTVAAAHEVDAVVVKVTATEGGVATVYAQQSFVVDTTAVDFTAADRAKLDATFAKLPSKAFLTGTANSDGDVQLDEATGTPADSAGIVAVKVVTDKYATMIVQDGGVSQFTANALELGPAGGGGGGGAAVDAIEARLAGHFAYLACTGAANLAAAFPTVLPLWNAGGGLTYNPDDHSLQAGPTEVDVANAVAPAVWTHGSRSLTSPNFGTMQSQLDLIAGKVGSIGVTSVVFSSTVAKDGSFRIVQGDDYVGRLALSWTITSTVDLTGGAARFAVMRAEDYRATGAATPVLSVDTVAIVPGAEQPDGSQLFTVTVTLTRGQTDGLPFAPPEHCYNVMGQVRVTLPDGLVTTPLIQAGTVTRKVVT